MVRLSARLYSNVFKGMARPLVRHVFAKEGQKRAHHYQSPTSDRVVMIRPTPINSVKLLRPKPVTSHASLIVRVPLREWHRTRLCRIRSGYLSASFLSSIVSHMGLLFEQSSTGEESIVR
jgi:hypothetical protein